MVLFGVGFVVDNRNIKGMSGVFLAALSVVPNTQGCVIIGLDL